MVGWMLGWLDAQMVGWLAKKQHVSPNTPF